MKSVLERGRRVAVARFGVQVEAPGVATEPSRRRPIDVRWLRSTALVSLCALTAVLLLSASALAVGPPSIGEESVTEVTATSAILRAQVNPEGAETHYYFQYGTTPFYGNDTPEAPGMEIPASEVAQGVSIQIQGLQPGTGYHYRLVVNSSQSPAGGIPGVDHMFTTQVAGGRFTLPDGRAYELVSPPQKDGAEILGIGGGDETPAAGAATQASADGSRVTYIATAPIGTNVPGNTASTQIFSTRGSGGWVSQDISTPHEKPIGLDNVLGEGEEYQRFSSDLSRAVLVPLHRAPEPPLAPEIHQEVRGGEFNDEIYLRNNISGTFQAVVRKEPLPEVTFEGVTADLSYLVFAGPPGLDPSYPTGGSLYEWDGEHTRLVDVQQNGTPGGGKAKFAGLGGVAGVRHAISNDGARVVWNEEGALFTRDLATGTTVQVDAAYVGGTSGGGVFQAASSDGSRVFFTDTKELTSGATEGGLFMFDTTDGTLADLTPGAGASQLQSFFGSNEEGTSLYEVSPAVLTSTANLAGETATAGARNLYLLREAPAGSRSWKATFVAQGAEEGVSAGGITAEAPLVRQTARISENARYLAFMSRASLTGYGNLDANGGQPDEEVYLYDGDTGRLSCASCNPTGARPSGEQATGEFPGIPMDPWRIWNTLWLAATIPGWTPTSSVSTGYQPRFLANSGRLFFDSADALVPGDVNGREDVYEYEPAGIDDCRSGRVSASEVYSEASGGCISLISAGTGSGDSAFFDASASGDDVFFTTHDGLGTQDNDGTSDMYDARVCTEVEPCPQSLAVSPPCTTTDSCRTAPSPQPGVFGAPASATFAGAGNLTATTKSTVKKKAEPNTASRLRAKRLAKELKACRTKQKRKRPACEVRARNKYGKASSSHRRLK